MARRNLNMQQGGRVTLDMILGAGVFGVVGAAIGFYLNVTGSIAIAALIGVLFGSLIGLLGGRRFFISIICGAMIGGALSALVAGRQTIPLGAASGGAMGGFLGVQIGMLRDLWRQHKNSGAPPTPSDTTTHER
jgi:hypothetical protein